MSELEEQSIKTLKKVCYGVCAFVSLLAMILVIISVSTTHWIVSSFTMPDGIGNGSIDASIGFFQLCFTAAGNSTCINLTSPISAPIGLLIVGLIILAFNIIVSLVLSFIKVPPSMAFVPVILLFLSSIFTMAGYSISWYYIFSYVINVLPTIIASNGIFIPTSVILLLVQNITVGYSYNLSVAGHFFTYVALALAAYMSGKARVK